MKLIEAKTGNPAAVFVCYPGKLSGSDKEGSWAISDCRVNVGCVRMQLRLLEKDKKVACFPHTRRSREIIDY